MLGIITGLKAESDLAKRFFPKALVVMSYATEEGACHAVEFLKRQKVSHILSFGCAGALTDRVSVGDILMPRTVLVAGEEIKTFRPDFYPENGVEKIISEPLLASEKLIESSFEKKSLFEKTGAFSVDMESGAAAQSGLPFSVLRVVCDEVSQTLPPAARVPLNEKGEPSLHLILISLLKNPFQFWALIHLGKNAFSAHRSMRRFLERLFGA